MTVLLITSALAVGALLAVQAAANLQLAAGVGSPVRASALQLALAAVLLLGLAGLAGSLGALEDVREAERWHLLGGLGSAVYVTVGILTVPRLGALAAMGLLIAGQMLASLAIDGFGLLGVTARDLGAAELAGAAAVLVAAGLIARSGGAGGSRRLPYQAAALVAGAVLAAQGPVNGALRDDLSSPLAASVVSFLVATAAMLLVLAAWRAGARPGAPLRTVPWWGWLGAAVGAAYVTAVPLLMDEIGAAATIGLTVAGQQLASLAVDRHGLLRLPRRAPTRSRWAGVVLLLAGVAAIQAG